MNPTSPTQRLYAGLLALLLGFVAPHQARAATTTASATAPKVNVDTTELGEAFAELAAAVAKRAAPFVEEAGYPSARVRIFWKNADEFHYAIAVALDDSITMEDAPVAATCRDCNSGQLEDAAIVAVETAIAQAKAAAIAEPTPVVAQEPEPHVEQRAEARPTDDPSSSRKADTQPRKKGLRTLGKVGVATVVIGLPVLGTGVAFAVIKERRPVNDVSMVRDFRPSGWALLGTGAALVVTGTILLIVDRTSNKGASNKSARVTPWLSPNADSQTQTRGASAGLVGRF